MGLRACHGSQEAAAHSAAEGTAHELVVPKLAARIEAAAAVEAAAVLQGMQQV